MPKRRNETTDQWLARVRAAREYVNRATASPRHQAQAEMAAFLELFHPDMPEDRRRELIRSAE